MKKIILLTFLSVLSFSSMAQLPMGDRTIGFSATNAQLDVTYDSTFSYALKACAKTNYQIFKWGEVETSAGIFDSLKLGDMDGLNAGLPLLGFQIDLTIATYDIVNKIIPSDLNTTPFDSPLMISRFQSFIDTVMNHFNSVIIHSLNIGNESDAAMGSSSLLIAQYKTFYEAVINYIHTNYPTIKVGTVITFGGLTNPATKTLYKTLNDSSDIIVCNYYNVNDTFYAKPPADVITDMNTLVTEYPTNMIYFMEFGYPSSISLNSSTTMQSQFVTDMFTAWDNNYNNIKHISYFSMSDWNHATAVQLAQSIGLDSMNNYVPFLESLGLRTWSGWGADKTAYNTFIAEAQARETCNPLSIDESLTPTEIKVYPAPASDQVVITIPNSNNHSIFSIYDMTGNLMFNTSGKKVGNSLRVSTYQWASGTYFIHLVSGTKSYNGKISIIR